MHLSAHDLSDGYSPNRPLFAGLTADFRAGALYGLIGPSGSGKSTLLGLLAGTRRPQRGHVARDGIDRVAWVLQNPVGSPRRTALDQISQPALYRGHTRAEAQSLARHLLKDFGLERVANREFRHLSGGEAQRLAFARAVSAVPHALLLDEPTAQLDRAAAESVRSVIRGLVDEERIVILATHDLSLADECDVVIDLADRDART